MNNYLNLRKERGMNILTQKFVKSLLVIFMVFGMVATTISNSMITIRAEGVDTLVADSTTLEEAFPDIAFREFVYEEVLGNGDTYVDATHSNHLLTAADIGAIEARTTISYFGGEGHRLDVYTMEGLQHFTSLEVLEIRNISSLTTLDVSTLINLRILTVNGTKVSTIDLSSNELLEQFHSVDSSLSGTLDLTSNPLIRDVSIFSSDVDEVVFSPEAKANLRLIAISSTKIGAFEFSADFVSLNDIAIRPFDDISDIVSQIVSIGIYRDDSVVGIGYGVRVWGDAGFLAQGPSGYYVVNENMNAQYRFNTPRIEGEGKVMYPHLSAVGPRHNFAEPALIDKYGNLIIGVTVSDISSDGNLSLTAGDRVLTAIGTMTITGNGMMKDGVITVTDGSFSVDKNTSSYDDVLKRPVTNERDIETQFDLPAGETATINTNGSESTVPGGTVIINNDGDKAVVVGESTVDSEGNITSELPWVELPAGETHVANPDGSITVPDGSVINYPDGTTETPMGPTTIYPDGTIIYSDDELLNKIDNAISALDKDSDGKVDADVTEAEFAAIQEIVDKIVDPAKKAEGQAKLDEARMEHIDSMLEALDADGNGRIDTHITVDDFAAIEDAIDYMTNSADKLIAQGKVDAAKVQLIEKLLDEIEATMDVSVDGSGDLTTTIGVADYEQVQDLITSLPNGAVKDGLQERLNDIRKDQIIDMIDALLDTNGDADPALATVGNLDKIEDLIAAMPWSTQKEEVIDYFLEKFGDIYYLVMQGFPVYTGQSTLVSAQISTPFTKFTNVYIGPIGDDNMANWTPLIRSYDGGVTGQYIAYEGSTFITLTRSYLETFGNGTYEIKVVFGNNVYVPLQLVVAKPATTSPANPNVPNTPNTGVAGSVLPWMGLVAVSAGASTFFMKKKNEEEVE